MYRRVTQGFDSNDTQGILYQLNFYSLNRQEFTRIGSEYVMQFPSDKEKTVTLNSLSATDEEAD